MPRDLACPLFIGLPVQVVYSTREGQLARGATAELLRTSNYVSSGFKRIANLKARASAAVCQCSATLDSEFV